MQAALSASDRLLEAPFAYVASFCKRTSWRFQVLVLLTAASATLACVVLQKGVDPRPQGSADWKKPHRTTPKLSPLWRRAQARSANVFDTEETPAPSAIPVARTSRISGHVIGAPTPAPTPQPTPEPAPEPSESNMLTPIPPTKAPATPIPTVAATPAPTQSKQQIEDGWQREPSPVCVSWANTEGLRELNAKREDKRLLKELPSAVGTRTSRACAGHRIPPRIPELKQNMQVPGGRLATAIARRAAWSRQQLTLGDVQALRERGVLNHFYLDRTLRVLGCMVPKAGSTTLKAYFLSNIGKWPGGGTVHNKSRFNEATLQAGDFISDEEFVELFNGGRVFKFTMVRNPFSRSLAAYLERFHECHRTRFESECQMWRRSLTVPGGEGLPNLRPGVLVEVVQGMKPRRGHIVELLPNDHVLVDMPAVKDQLEQSIQAVPLTSVRRAELGRDTSFVHFLEALRAHPTRKVTWQNAHWLASSDVCAVDVIQYDWVGRLEVTEDWKLLYNVVGTKAGFDEAQKRSLKHSVGTASATAEHFTLENIDRVEDIFSFTDIGLLGYKAESKGGPLRGRRYARRQPNGRWAAVKWTPPPTPTPPLPTPAPPPPGSPVIPVVECRWAMLPGVAVHFGATSGTTAAAGVVRSEKVHDYTECWKTCDARPRCHAVSWQKIDAGDGNLHRCFFVLHGYTSKTRIAASPHYDGWLCRDRQTVFAQLTPSPPTPQPPPTVGTPAPGPGRVAVKKVQVRSDGRAEPCMPSDWVTLPETAVHQTRGAVKEDKPSTPVFGLDACRRRCDNMPDCVGAAWRRGGAGHQYFHKCFYITKLGADPQQARAEFDSTYCQSRANLAMQAAVANGEEG
eukprot:TRINITY_DN35832_c0_g1_i1.p1 TRINITY_DN35832_c0_g1~~TRINITY_DN35832_c0_g1_i1.p1  ORF type:complete len:853 (+),score=76.07 TRINITY_DN35832_c0_g1_i1:132-2690(+)